MKKVVNQWRIIVSGTEYTAPEVRRFHLQGIATWLEDEQKKLTSTPIVGWLDDGNVIVTRSGSEYQLGTPANGPEDEEVIPEDVTIYFGKNMNEIVKECPHIPLT